MILEQWNTCQVRQNERLVHAPRGCNAGAQLGSKVYGKHAAHDIFVDFDAKSVIDLLGNADTTEPWIAALHLDDGCDELCGRAGPGFRFRWKEENSRRYFRWTSAAR